MDASQSALDSLRTVDFRESLRGFHKDDVDEFLERAAVEAEGLQEQLRQAGERLRQAGERIAQLEAEVEHAQSAPPAPAEPNFDDESLKRTLVLAQQFVDQTKADAESRSQKMIADAEAHARKLTEDAKTTAAQISAEAEGKLRAEIERLEAIRQKLSADVETMARHLEGERVRLRGAIGEVLTWVDENLKPVTAMAPKPAGAPQGGGRPAAPLSPPTRSGPLPGGGGAPSAQPGPTAQVGGVQATRPSGTMFDASSNPIASAG